jgi:hypothetical protein
MLFLYFNRVSCSSFVCGIGEKLGLLIFFGCFLHCKHYLRHVLLSLIVFNIQIGWPSSLPTNEKGLFTKSVLQEKVNVLTLGCFLMINVIFLWCMRTGMHITFT